MNEQMREILDLINEMSEEEGSIELHDEFDIELNEDIVIESGVIDIDGDRILIECDDKALKLLEQHGLTLEETDWSKYDEPTINRIKKGVTKPVDTTDYDIPTYLRKAEGPKPKTGYEKRRADLIKKGILKADGEIEEALDLKTLRAAAAKVAPKSSSDNNTYDPKEKLKRLPKNEIPTRDGKLDLNALRDMVKEEDVEESGLQAYLGKKKYGEKGMKALQQAGREGASKEEMAKLRAKYDKLDEGPADEPVHPDQDADDKRFDDIDEAKYQGREVPLGKPMAGDVKKSKVYVKGPKGNVVKVNFGDKKMRIKKSNPKRRKSFRARHNCKNPGPRWKARYWSCRAW